MEPNTLCVVGDTYSPPDWRGLMVVAEGICDSCPDHGHAHGRWFVRPDDYFTELRLGKRVICEPALEPTKVTSPLPTGMCPHCGAILLLRDTLTSSHVYENAVCPGSGQNPRCAESDGRPLWNGQPNPHFRGATDHWPVRFDILDVKYVNDLMNHGRLLITHGRSWLKLTHEDVERGAKAVVTDPVYRKEIYRSALKHADNMNPGLWTDLVFAYDTLTRANFSFLNQPEGEPTTMSDPAIYHVYQVSAHEEESGKVWVPITQVEALNHKSAEHKAVAMLSAAVAAYNADPANAEEIKDGEIELDAVLDVAVIVVHPFA